MFNFVSISYFTELIFALPHFKLSFWRLNLHFPLSLSELQIKTKIISRFLYSDHTIDELSTFFYEKTIWYYWRLTEIFHRVRLPFYIRQYSPTWRSLPALFAPSSLQSSRLVLLDCWYHLRIKSQPWFNHHSFLETILKGQFHYER